jgi:Ca2+-binding EF-hand superfamily protein
MRETITGVKSRKACIIELASRVPEESFEDLKAAFRMNDEDGSGKLNKDDFVRCLKIANMKINERELEILLNELDQK